VKVREIEGGQKELKMREREKGEMYRGG